MITCSYQNMSVQNWLIEPIEVCPHNSVQFTGTASKSAVMALSSTRITLKYRFISQFLSEARTLSPTKPDKNAPPFLSTFSRSTFDTYQFTLSLRSLTAPRQSKLNWLCSMSARQVFNAGFMWSMKWLKLPLPLSVLVLTGEYPVKAKARSRFFVLLDQSESWKWLHRM